MAYFISILYLVCMSIAALSYSLLLIFRAKNKHSKLRGGYAKYSLFISVMAVLSNLVFIAIFLSPRGELKLDPPGGDPVYIFTLMTFFIVTATSFN